MSAARTAFIEKYKKDFIDAVVGTGLFASVSMAQALLESGDGNSGLAKNHNNIFGIKASSGWTGKTVTMDTTEVVNGKPITVKAAFRKYDTVFDSLVDRIKFLKNNSRYTKAGVFSAATPEQQAKALLTAGYATDPQYATKLINIINEYDLKSLDKVKGNVLRMTTTTKRNVKNLAAGLVLLSLASYLVIKLKKG